MAQPNSRVSYRALAIIFGILVLFLVIYSDLQARLRRLVSSGVTQTVSVTAATSPSSTATEFLKYQTLMTPILLVGMIIMAAVFVSILFDSVSRKRRLANIRNPPPEGLSEERVT